MNSSDKENVEENSTEPKRRGRPKGVKVGPRTVYWVCAEVVDGELVLERFAGGSEEEAQGAFTEKYRVEAGRIDGPFHEYRGGIKAVSKPRKRDTVEIPPEQLKFSKESHDAIYGSWYGRAFELEGRSDALFFIPSRPVSETEKKKTTPAPKAVLRSAVRLVS